MVDKKLQRMEYLGKVIEKYTKTEPELSIKEVCEVLVWHLGDISELIKIIKKEAKK